MSPELDADLRALEAATDFTLIRDAYARVDAVATRRGMIFLGQILPIALGVALALWASQIQGWLPRYEWVLPVGSFFGAVLIHSFAFRKATADFQRIGFALRKWRAIARTSS